MVRGLNADCLGWVGTEIFTLVEAEYLRGKSFRRKFIGHISSVGYRGKHKVMFWVQGKTQI